MNWPITANHLKGKEKTAEDLKEEASASKAKKPQADSRSKLGTEKLFKSTNQIQAPQNTLNSYGTSESSEPASQEMSSRCTEELPLLRTDVKKSILARFLPEVEDICKDTVDAPQSLRSTSEAVGKIRRHLLELEVMLILGFLLLVAFWRFVGWIYGRTLIWIVVLVVGLVFGIIVVPI